MRRRSQRRRSARAIIDPGFTSRGHALNPNAQPVVASRTLVETDRFLGLDDVVFPPRSTRATTVKVAEDPILAAAPVQRRPAAPSPLPVQTRSETLPTPTNAPLVLPSGPDKQSRLDALAVMHAQQCGFCQCSREQGSIFGEGSANARVFFVGEVPTDAEVAARRPLAGESGAKLEEMIRAMKLTREDVYLANILKSPLPELRAPSALELAHCAPYLRAQIEIIQPTVIITLGGPAAKFILSSEFGISRLRGVWGSIEIAGHAIPVMPTFHPAYLLRNYTDETRAAVWHDLKQVIERLRES